MNDPYREPIDGEGSVDDLRAKFVGGVSSHEKRAERKHSQEKEHVTESVPSYDEILKRVQTDAQDDDSDHKEISRDAQDVAAESSVEGRVERLIDLALTKGPVYAVKVARHVSDFYALDKVHDELACHFFEKLREKKLL